MRTGVLYQELRMEKEDRNGAAHPFKLPVRARVLDKGCQTLVKDARLEKKVLDDGNLMAY